MNEGKTQIGYSLGYIFDDALKLDQNASHIDVRLFAAHVTRFRQHFCSVKIEIEIWLEFREVNSCDTP
jgi:hypothetical protein